jgi:hypothetical protein
VEGPSQAAWATPGANALPTTQAAATGSRRRILIIDDPPYQGRL